MSDGERAAEVLVLGPFGVRGAGGVSSPSSGQVRLLVATLALAGARGQSTPELTEAVWAGAAAGRHRTALPVAVHRARRWLATAAGAEIGIGSTPTGYVLTGGVDADRFAREVAAAERLPAADQAAALAAALDLWRGEDPLPDVPLSQALEATADGLRRARLAAALRLGRLLLRLGRPADAVAALESAARHHPLDEQVQSAVIEVLAASGRRAEALERYDRVRQRLADELGVDPGRQLSETLVRVLRHDLPAEERPAPPAWAPDGVPAQLPPVPAGFTGRTGQLAELDRLREAAAGGSVVIRAVDGIGGVGKTALALRWAHQGAGRYPDGQLYLDLRGHAQAEPLPVEQALGRLLRSLGVPAEQVPAEVEEAAALYRSLLAGRRVLVLLDNARDVTQVRPLLPGAPSCLALVTSRDRLDGLVALEGAGRMTLDVLDPGEACALLAGVLGAARVAAEAGAAAELARLCGHLPLALRVVAAQVAADPGRSLAAQVAALRADRWGELAVAGDPRACVRTAFDLSYQRLDRADRRLFRLLGLAPGADLDADAAAVLAGLPPAEARRALRRLVAAHLVRAVGGRYSLHDLVADYARQRAEPDDPAAVTLLCRWYLATADAAAERLYPEAGSLALPAVAAPDPPGPREFAADAAALAWLDAEIGTLAAVAAHAAEHGPYEIAWRLAGSLTRFLSRRGHPAAQWSAFGRTALAAADRAGDPRGAAVAHRVLAGAAWYLGGPPTSIEHYEQARAAARRAGWVAGEVSALNGLAAGHARHGDAARAATLYREAIESADAHGLVAVRNWALANLVTVLHWQGRFADALACYDRLPAWRNGTRTGDPVLLRASLAALHRDRGDLAEAERVAVEGIEVARRAGVRYAEGDCLQVLATVYCDAGRPEDALRPAETARDLAVDIGNRMIEEAAACTLGAAHHHLGRYDEARSHLEHALRLTAVSGDVPPELDALVQLAATLDALGRPDEALERAWQARALAHRCGHAVREADALAALAAVHLRRGNTEAAAAHATSALTAYRRSGAALREARARQLLDATSPHPAAPHPAAS